MRRVNIAEVFILVVILSVTTGARHTKQTITEYADYEESGGTIDMTKTIMHSGIGGGIGFGDDSGGAFFNRTIVEDAGNETIVQWNSSSTSSNVLCSTEGIQGFNFQAMAQLMQTMSNSMTEVMKSFSDFQNVQQQSQYKVTSYESKLTTIDQKLDQILAATEGNGLSDMLKSIQRLEKRIGLTVQNVSEILEMEKNIQAILLEIQGNGRGYDDGGDSGVGKAVTSKMAELEESLKLIRTLIERSNQEQLLAISKVGSEVSDSSLELIKSQSSSSSTSRDTSVTQKMLSQTFQNIQQAISKSVSEQISSLESSLEITITKTGGLGSLSSQLQAIVSQMSDIKTLTQTIENMSMMVTKISKKSCTVTIDGEFSRQLKEQMQKV